MKKIISLLLILTTLISCFALFSVGSNAAVSSEGRLPFKDVPENEWYAYYAEFCYANGIITGQGNTYTFAPNANLTRATFVVMLARAMGADLSSYTYTSFTDCPTGTWYTPSVVWAAQKGYVTGTGNGKFSPNATITREQAAVMFSRILASLGKNPENTTETLKYTDIYSASNWAIDGVKYIINMGIMSSTSSNKYTFSPSKVMTRGQIAKMIAVFLSDFSDCKHRTRTEVSCVKGDWCRSCGLKFTLANGHNVPGLSCVTGGSCTTCGTYVSADKELHNYTEATCTTASVCKTCGASAGNALGHTTKFGICTRCKAEIFPNEWYRIGYYMTVKGKDNGKGVYTYSSYYVEGYSTEAKLTYDANNSSYKYYFKYRSSNSSYLEFTITMPYFANTYNISFKYMSDRATEIASGSGTFNAPQSRYSINYSYDDSFSTDKIDSDIESVLQLGMDNFEACLYSLCEGNIKGLNFYTA